jgi:hypothetical protein
MFSGKCTRGSLLINSRVFFCLIPTFRLNLYYTSISGSPQGNRATRPVYNLFNGCWTGLFVSICDEVKIVVKRQNTELFCCWFVNCFGCMNQHVRQRSKDLKLHKYTVLLLLLVADLYCVSRINQHVRQRWEDF